MPKLPEVGAKVTTPIGKGRITNFVFHQGTQEITTVLVSLEGDEPGDVNWRAVKPEDVKEAK